MQGFTAPYTPTGRSALVTAPPWHCDGLLGMPSLVIGSAAPKCLVRSTVANLLCGPLHHRTGTLHFFDHPRDELRLLAPLDRVIASVGDVAQTITGMKQMQPW